MEAGQRSEREEVSETDSDAKSPEGPVTLRKNPPKRLSCESQVVKTESDQQKIERGLRFS